jgi:hypothetical protein
VMDFHEIRHSGVLVIFIDTFKFLLISNNNMGHFM